VSAFDLADLTPVELLTTTRSVRKRLDLDRPVPRELILQCVAVATQAPSGSNLQGWAFLVVDDPAGKKTLAGFYRRSHAGYAPRVNRRLAEQDASAPVRLKDSVDFLAANLERVPALVIPLQRGRVDAEAGAHHQAGFYGSIFPAVWSFMLAARLHRLGTSLTTMHLAFEREVAAAFGVPFDRYTQVGLIAVGYYRGHTFSPAIRVPPDELVHWNSW
jgi:nitroreductase